MLSVCAMWCGAIFTDTDGHPWIPCAPVSCQTKPEQPFSLDTTCSDQEPRQTGSQPWFLVTSPDQPPALIKLLTVKIPDSCDHDSPHHNLFTNSNLLSENINQCKSLSYSVFSRIIHHIRPLKVIKRPQYMIHWNIFSNRFNLCDRWKLIADPFPGRGFIQNVVRIHQYSQHSCVRLDPCSGLVVYRLRINQWEGSIGRDWPITGLETVYSNIPTLNWQ